MADDQSKKRTTVTIYGQQYTIVGDEQPSHINQVANYLDKRMKEYKAYNPYLDTTRLAVLTALNVVDDYIKLKEEVNKDRDSEG
ncbi:cell division protein ZapA [Marinococcus sp. PL1-022]|uniref:cell division protein ZapA n=1 Tax=Marinococcus sp. PL1-022 TaxID=3095363 RepID=UPI00262131D7|nr:cell division protein ZapA [Marinococcus sp. PL1-022]MDX6152043.1 cell division protein ZapA [Marinococcus sp. PL1-022]